ncbi:zf-HC2 domain-containing protein [Parafrankia sp. FMc2]|uniref:zf-HC2 domain-containing protein n=1 Tax=Parafrankia sp. FMc2 TaxID=3233196 RepID=UPI0034D5BEBC
MSGHLGERLTPLVDGQLGHDDRDRALAHVARCPACQAEVAEQRLIKSRLARLAEPSLPSGLAANLLNLGAREYRAAPPIPPPPAPLRIPAMASGFVAGRAERAQRAGSRPELPGPGLSRPETSRPAPRANRGGGTVAAARTRPPGPALPARRRELAVRPGPAAGRPPGPGSSRAGAYPYPAQSGSPRGGPAPTRRPVRAARSNGRGRMRRTLVGSAAFMLLAVSGSALADGRAASRPNGPATIVPTVVTAIPAKAPSVSVSRPGPMIASASFPRP